MVVILNPKTSKEEIKKLTGELEALGVTVNPVIGTEMSILGLVGDTTKIDSSYIEANPYVERVMKVQEPFKKANRLFHPENTVIDVNGHTIGGNKIAIIAGPCSVESKEQISLVANEVKKYGASFLRGGAFKPRTSPYSFQGMGLEGLKCMYKAKQAYNMPIVSELMSEKKLDEFEEYVDLIQVGARNMQNFDLLKALGKSKKPVLLKRGLANTMEEWIMAAEYIMAGGNENVIMCERGIRTFETYTRNTLDLSVIPIIKSKTHLPIIIDPSHATGDRKLVESMSLAAIAAGADGLIIEVHDNPECAWSDGAQSVTPDAFKTLIEKGKKIANVIGRDM
mgnify:CR=1 FL=1